MTIERTRPRPETLRQVDRFPSTRFMGSKRRLLPHILGIVESMSAETCIDLFSGSGVVSYGLKSAGLRTHANDHMAMAAAITTALVQNSSERLEPDELEALLEPNPQNDGFVQRTYQGLYFNDLDNFFIDSTRANIDRLSSPHKRAIATSSLIRACFKKRPRGLFSYVGYRYDDGRRDLALSFAEQLRLAVSALNEAVFGNGQTNVSSRLDALSVRYDAELAYVDPPYFSLFSDNEYVRRYHFVEGLACGWKDVEFQWHTKTKKFKSYPTPFASRSGAAEALRQLFLSFPGRAMIVSYSSNSLPSKEDMVRLLKQSFVRVEVVAVDLTYSFGTQSQRINDNNNSVSEYLFVAER